MRRILWMLMVLSSMTSAFAQNALNVLTPISYVEGVAPPDKVKAECSVESYLQTALETNLSKKNVVTFTNTAPPAGRLLRVQILNIDAVGGGGWTGAKSLSIRVELSADGTVMRKTAFTRSSRGGFGGAFVGTCSMLNRAAEALGKDVAKWMADPRYSAQDVVEEPASAPAQAPQAPAASTPTLPLN
ncbi:MAG: hypothetical protein C4K60_13545 [Ideonella sp. MAG2]|nr:MAG: hypothetical protein C4K60_13545 [Ideonella sp. MAG2]